MNHKICRRSLAVLCALTLLLSLAACGGGKEPQHAPQEDPAQSWQGPEQKTEPAFEPGPAPGPEPKKEPIPQTFTIDDLTYDFDNGKLTMTGSGQVTNKAYEYVLEQCGAGKEDLTELVFGDGVGFGNKLVFLDCVNLTRVTLPENIDTICREMFAYCKSLKTVGSSAAFKEIGDAAFLECVSLEKMVDLAPGVRIGTHAFYGCTSLKEAVLPERSSIGIGAFTNTGLVRMTLPADQSGSSDYTIVRTPTLTDVTLLNGEDRYWVGSFYTYAECIPRDYPDYPDYQLTIHAPAGSYAETYIHEQAEKKMQETGEECRVTFEALP